MNSTTLTVTIAKGEIVYNKGRIAHEFVLGTFNLFKNYQEQAYYQDNKKECQVGDYQRIVGY